jgi:hypothetical protein
MKIPASFMFQKVVVALSIPLQERGDSGTKINFPLIEGQIVEVEEDSLVVDTTAGDKMLVPTLRVQHIVLAKEAPAEQTAPEASAAE